jgi:tRNA(fMet)-specific endonuclease VapC
VSLLLLDTTFLVDAERGDFVLDDVIDDEDEVAIAAISVAELLVGVKLSSGRRRRSRQAYADDIIDSLRIIPYDTSIAREHADLLAAVRKVGRPRGAHDLIIAATARATNRAVVTSDTRAFIDLPGVVISSHR